MTSDEALRLARQQLTVLQRVDKFSKKCLKDLELGDKGTTLYDLNGTDILLRAPLIEKGHGEVGYADLAMAPDLGTVLFSIVRGKVWDEERIREETADAGLNSDGFFVAYEYPRVGIEIRVESEGRQVRDWLSGEVKLIGGQSADENSVAEGYSLLEGLSPILRQANRERYDSLRHSLGTLTLEEAKTGLPPARCETVEINYSKCPQSHECFELRTRTISYWCVPTSVEMLLAFYRYEYSQRDIASALGQETLSSGAIDLRPGGEYVIVEAISTLTRGALHARMYSRGLWLIVKEEIAAARPLILVAGGHARVVTGYSILNIGGTSYDALILYDPLGFEVCWEAFNPSSDLLLFSAALRHWRAPGGTTVRPCTDPAT
jgi:hypothetical protein